MSKTPKPPATRSASFASPGGDPVLSSLRTGADVEETAKFVADFATELSSLARNSQLDLLAYLLDMARLEAIRVVQAQHRGP